ncbi:MAG: VWA domain-containing protein [Gammaproteobacteria bacterium]|nr:VWA domain-containing protein [Gammaproteobacteria bacterium]
MLRILVFLAVTVIAAGNANAGFQDIILIIDNSGSMKNNDPDYLTRKTVAKFVTGLSDQQRPGLLLFGTQSRLISDLNSADQLGPRIDSGLLTEINYRDKWTDTAAAIELALYELKMNGSPDAEPVIIILTDGIVDTGDKLDSQRRREWIMGGLAQQARQESVRIFGIAFTAAADYELLQTLGHATQGDYFRILSAEDITSVFTKINQQLLELPLAPALTNKSEDALDALNEFAFDLIEEPASSLGQNPIRSIAEPSKKPISEQPDDTQIPEFSGRTSHAAKAIEPADEPKPIVADKPLTDKKPDQLVSTASDMSWLVAPVIGIALMTALGTYGWVWLKRPKIVHSAPEAVLHDLEKASGHPRIEVTGSITRIGRDPGRETWHERPRILILENPGISRLHAILEYRADGYWFTDQNSKNGCKVNYENSRLPRKLQSGDKIQIAKLEFIFELPIAEETDETVLFGQ